MLSRFSVPLSLAGLFLGFLPLLTRSASAFGGQLPQGLPGPDDFTTAPQVIGGILNQILNLVALAAVVVIIIAGIRLILSLGGDEGKETAKKTIIYTLAGLLVILFAKAIVSFVTRLG